MGKNPAFQFYVRDWLSDPQLKMVSFQTKGIWMDFPCYLWESPDRGTLSATPEKFCQMLGCSQAEWDQFIQEASVTNFADVTNSNACVTVKNRRMYREEKERENTRLRVERFRQKQVCNATSNDSVTVPSSSSSSSSSSNTNTHAGSDGNHSQPENEELYVVRVKKRVPESLNQNRELWTKAYPAVDLDQECNKALAWLISHLKNRKQNIDKFLNAWLSRAQENAPSKGASGGMTRPPAEKEKTFAKCPECGRETTQADLDKFGSCPACFKPLTPEKMKELASMLGNIGMEIPKKEGAPTDGGNTATLALKHSPNVQIITPPQSPTPPRITPKVETENQKACFKYYLELGAERTLAAVAANRKFHVSEKILKEWAEQWDWAGRI